MAVGIECEAGGLINPSLYGMVVVGGSMKKLEDEGETIG